MYEDAKCNKPCGLEPMGCCDCDPWSIGTEFSNSMSYELDVDWDEWPEDEQ